MADSEGCVDRGWSAVMENIKIIVATHKKYEMPKDAMYLPVQVERKARSHLDIKEIMKKSIYLRKMRITAN